MAIASSRAGPVRSKASRTRPSSRLLVHSRVERAEEADARPRPKRDAVADREPPPRPGQRPPAVASTRSMQRRRRLRRRLAALAPAGELRRDHLGVVDDEDVAGAQEGRADPTTRASSSGPRGARPAGARHRAGAPAGARSRSSGRSKSNRRSTRIVGTAGPATQAGPPMS